MDEFKAAMSELYEEVGADANRPQEVSRRFGINKNLAWKLSRMIGAAEPAAALPHLPGSSGMEIFLGSLKKAGATPDRINRVREAAKAIDSMVEAHVGSKATLELVLDGLAEDDAAKLDVSRRLLFRGASGVWGVQAKTRIMAGFMAPNPDDPAWLDLVIVAGYHEFRRLRGSVRWPLFRMTSWGNRHDDRAGQSLDPDPHPAAPLLLRAFCSEPLPKIDVEPTDRGVDYVLAPGPVGNYGACDLYIGERSIGSAERYATPDDPWGTFGVVIASPVENLLMDVYIHEEVDTGTDIQMKMFGGVFGHGEAMHGRSAGREELPISGEMGRVPGTPPVPSTPLAPGYSGPISAVFERMGWDPASFHGTRCVVKYPPLGCTAIMQVPLPEAPGR
jgi:hypothetical protein